MAERQATFPSVFASGIIARNPKIDEVASGAGVGATMPFFKDITDQDDEVQIENQGPANDLGIGTDKMVCTILNRVCKNSVTALSGQVSGTDPLGQIIRSMTARRLKQRNKTLIAMMRGQFGSAGARNGAAALSGIRLGGVTAEPFDESGADATVDQLVNPDMFIDAKALMGELADDLSGGLFLCHPNVKARLEKLDAQGFKSGRPSELPFNITTYRDIQIITSERLIRPGATNGFVYDSYLIGHGVIGYGEKAQEGDVVAVASLQYAKDAEKNNETIYDRTRFVLHTNGLRWTGIPAGQSASNAELQYPANWALAWGTPNRVGAVCFHTNG